MVCVKLKDRYAELNGSEAVPRSGSWKTRTIARSTPPALPAAPARNESEESPGNNPSALTSVSAVSDRMVPARAPGSQRKPAAAGISAMVNRRNGRDFIGKLLIRVRGNENLGIGEWTSHGVQHAGFLVFTIVSENHSELSGKSSKPEKLKMFFQVEISTLPKNRHLSCHGFRLHADQASRCVPEIVFAAMRLAWCFYGKNPARRAPCGIPVLISFHAVHPLRETARLLIMA